LSNNERFKELAIMKLKEPEEAWSPSSPEMLSSQVVTPKRKRRIGFDQRTVRCKVKGTLKKKLDAILKGSGADPKGLRRHYSNLVTTLKYTD
jgi:hypothetical protein